MDSYIGTIMPWPSLRVPVNWHWCDGTLLPINGYEALYTLWGTRFGGDGRTNFGIPDLRGRAILGCYMGVGATTYPLGQAGGLYQTPVQPANMPQHTHTTPTPTNASGTYKVSSVTGTAPSPTNNRMGSGTTTNTMLYSTAAPTVAIGKAATGQFTIGVSTEGSASLVQTTPPFVGMNFICCLNGLFPDRQ